MVEGGGGQGVGAPWAGEGCTETLWWYWWWCCAATLVGQGAWWCWVVEVLLDGNQLLLPCGPALEVGWFGHAGVVCQEGLVALDLGESSLEAKDGNPNLLPGGGGGVGLQGEDGEMGGDSDP